MSDKRASPVAPFRATLRDLKHGIDVAVKQGVDLDAVILWADQTNNGDRYSREGVPNGTILLGIEEHGKDGVLRGTLRIEPSMLSDILQ